MIVRHRTWGLTIFRTNGGPGCSSLEGLLQENGVCFILSNSCASGLMYVECQPFSWGVGQAKPTLNEFSWTNLSSVLWVEQPVGTGFSQGKPNIKVCCLTCYLERWYLADPRMRTTLLLNWLALCDNSWKSSQRWKRRSSILRARVYVILTYQKNRTIFADAIDSSMRGDMCHVGCSYPDTKWDYWAIG